ncbi:putative Adenylate cyclase [Verrucomicrobia bacterium]|nr:putative Adenylate cyclase [Verrucomicrobiota bacterium]
MMQARRRFMPIPSFRLKLALAMMLLVAGGTLTTLLIVEHRVEVYYQRHFRAQFDREIAYFLTLQEARLATVKDQCLKLSQKVRIIAAMSEQEIPAEILYDVTDDEWRALLGTVFREARHAGMSTPVKSQATFFRYLDAHGRPVPPPENVRNLGFPASGRRLDQKLTQVRGALNSQERQQVGYLAFTSETNRASALRNVPAHPEEIHFLPLQEVVVTKILEPDSNRVLGALVLGFPLSELIPRAKTDASATQASLPDPIQSGILIEGHLYANTNAIAEPIGRAMAQEITHRIELRGKLLDDFEWKFGDAYFRLYFRLLNQQSGFPPAYQVCAYSLDEERAEQQQLRGQILGSGAAALLGALALGLFLSHGLSVPLRGLASAAGEIRRGNLSVRVPVRGGDEIGQLAGSFNEMAEGLAQKERYRTVLNQVADEKVAQQLISGEITLGGEVRQASVLFCDIRGFTALTENMPPAEVIEMLNEHMTALTRIVKQHHGVLDKFVGDLLMAIFGAPVSRPTDVIDAAHCALGLLRERKALNQTSRHKLEIGIGLATGLVVAGAMGSADRFHYTVLGERVNLASRLCDLAGVGEILIDQTTFQALGDGLVAQPLRPMTLKGFAEPVPVFKLTTANVASNAP